MTDAATSSPLRLGVPGFSYADLYAPDGPYRGVIVAGVVAWAAGAAVYYLARSWGGTLPGLLTAVAVYLLAARRRQLP